MKTLWKPWGFHKNHCENHRDFAETCKDARVYENPVNALGFGETLVKTLGFSGNL